MGNTILKATGITKIFSGVVALADVNFNLKEGEVHALMGENGAGKSTLSKIFAGIHPQTAGTFTLFGKECSFCSINDAQKNGISIVTQEFSLLPNFSIAENIFINDSDYYYKGIFKNTKKMVEATRNLLKLFKLENYLNPLDKISNLSTAQCQVIEIVKALSKNTKIIILDEPTASLSSLEIDLLFELINDLKAKGVSFILVSHKINEIYAISDRITVLRDGKLILDGVELSQLSQNDLIKAMVGREINDLYGLVKDETEHHFSNDDVFLKIRHVSDFAGCVNDVSFDVQPGMIIGFSGLIGAGRTELMRCVFGADPMKQGKIILDNKEIQNPTIKNMMKNRIVYVSEDRKTIGLHQELSVIKNINLSSLVTSKSMIINSKDEMSKCNDMVEKMNIKIPTYDSYINTLSGGNQQKVLLGKWLLLKPRVLIVDEPTRGIDIGAKAEIYKLFRKLASEGMAIIVVSSEIPEILGICDYAYIMREGRITGSFPVSELDDEKIGYYSTIG